MTIHEFLESLEFGARYYKPGNMTWHDLEYHIESDRYAKRFRSFRLHRLRGDMFCLACRCCGAVDSPRREP